MHLLRISFYTNLYHCGSVLETWKMCALWKHLNVFNRNPKHFISFILQFTGRQIHVPGRKIHVIGSCFFRALNIYVREIPRKISLCISSAIQFVGDRTTWGIQWTQSHIQITVEIRLWDMWMAGTLNLEKRDTHLGIYVANTHTHTHTHHLCFL